MTVKVAHLTTVDMSLRFLVFPQLEAVRNAGGESIGISAPGPWVAELEDAGIRHIPLEASTRGMNLWADLRAIRQLWRVLRTERLDLLHTHNPKPGLYGRVLGRLAGVPIVVNTVHGLYATDDDPLSKRILVYALEALAARFSDAELVQNREDLDLMERLRIASPKRMRLLGNGVDLSRFDPEKLDPGRADRVRRELGVADGQILAGVVGRLVAEKGYPELFEAFRTLGSRYVLACVGPHDPDKSDAIDPVLMERARRDGVRFLGMREDVEDIYPAMDLFVLPSHREGFPRAAMEAAAMGLPIVATNIRGCRQVVTPGHNGLLVPVGAPGALAEAILTIGEDAELRERMGQASRAKARAEFDERRVVEIVMGTYRDVALDKGLPDLVLEEASPPIELRFGVPADAAALARIHATSIETGFLPSLGPRFLRRLYQALIAHPRAVVVVADDGTRVAGFVAGVEDVGDFYRHFVRHHGFLAALAALPRLLRPGNLRRAWESLRYGGSSVHLPAELLSMAVIDRYRGRGVGTRLGRRFLDELTRRQVSAVKVVVGAENTGAIAAYRKIGFDKSDDVEIHRGEPSVVLVWAE